MGGCRLGRGWGIPSHLVSFISSHLAGRACGVGCDVAWCGVAWRGVAWCGVQVWPAVVAAHLNAELPFMATEVILMQCVKVRDVM